MNEHKQAIDAIYESIDNFIALAPGWGKRLLQTTEQMFQLLDSIEGLYDGRAEDDETEENS